MTVEGDIQANARLAVGKLRHARWFRNNRGVFWAGKPVQRTPVSVTLMNPRQVECGLVDGASDLIGLTQITIGPEHIGQTLAVFTAAEVKRPGKNPEPHQQKFLDFVIEFGGLAGVVRSPEDALDLVGRGR